MIDSHGVDSEVGRLQTVLVHRPGLELKRMTPRAREHLLFDALPWVGRAQQEHDVLTRALREQGVEVLYVTELLQDALEYQPARIEAIGSVLADPRLGDELRTQLRGHLASIGPESLAQVLICGLSSEEFRTGSGVVFELLDRGDFVIEPLPNLVFVRDSSFWVGDRVAVSSLADGRRRRESELLGVIYRHHPRFAGTRWLYGPGLEWLDGGDVLLLAHGVLAVGVGERTTPAAVERLARHAFGDRLAHLVLAIPIDQRGDRGHLDTVCTVVDDDTVVMHPALAFALTAYTIRPGPDGMRVSRRRPFLEAAASAIGAERLNLIETGLDPVARPREQWEDGSNALAIDRRLAVCYERNVETNSRLEAAGVRVIRVPSSELGSRRGGPRCMCCPVDRVPARAGVPAGRFRPAERQVLRRDRVLVGAAGPAVEEEQAVSEHTVPVGTGAAGSATADATEPDRPVPDPRGPEQGGSR